MELTDKRRSLIFINILITCIASSMLATALNTALPVVINDLNINVNTGQWLTSAYSLAMGIMMPLTAYLIRRFPSRKLYLTAILVFLSGLTICALAPNFPVMMAGRILQACGNGILTSMAQVILLSIYPAEKKGTIMGWYGLSVGAAPVIAPTLAGILVDYLGWRMIFYIAIGIMLISLVFALRVFSDVLSTIKQKFDVISFVMSGFAFAGLTLGIGNMGSYPFLSRQVGFILIIGVIALILFIYRQFHNETPFLELRILKSREYALSVIGSMFLYFIMMGSSVLMPLYIQSILGLSATVSALVTLPGSLIMAVISPFAGRIYDKIGMKTLFISGAICLILSNIGMCFVTMQTTVWVSSLLNVIRNVAIGCLMMPLVTWGTSSVKKELTADATALLTSLRTIAGAIGTAVFVGIMTFVAGRSAGRYGENAPMHGLNATFLAMGISSAILLMMAVFFVKKPIRSQEQKAK